MGKILKIDNESIQNISKGNFDIILRKKIRISMDFKAKIKKGKEDINQKIQNFF